jgi:hypothetical protein
LDARRKRHIAIISVALAVFLLFGDLAVTSSHTSATLSGGHSGTGESLHGAGDIQILISRDVHAARSMAMAVIGALEEVGLVPSRAPLRYVRLIHDRADLDPDRPVFAVYRMKVWTAWTPLFSVSRASLEYGFASKASILPEPTPAVVMCRLDAPSDFALRAKVTLKQTSWGFMTWPGSRRLACRAAAHRAVEFLARALATQDAGETNFKTRTCGVPMPSA